MNRMWRRIWTALLIAGLVVVGIAGRVNASEWTQEHAYRDLTTNPSDTVRYGLRSRLAKEIDELAPDGTILNSIQFPQPTGWLTEPGFLAISGDLLVVSYVIVNEEDTTDAYCSLSMYRRGVELSRASWPAETCISDVALNEDWVFVAQTGFGDAERGVSVVPTEALLDWGVPSVDGPGDCCISASSTFLSFAESIAAIATMDQSLFVFTIDGRVAEYSSALEPVDTTTLLGWADFIVDGHPGIGNTFVLETISAPDSNWCSVSVHRADGSLQDCFLSQPGGARFDDVPQYGRFDVDRCGGIVLPDVNAADGHLTGHKLIPSNRDPGCFVDSFDSIFVRDIGELGRSDVTRGCNPPDNDKFCPKDTVTRGALAAFFSRAFHLDATQIDFFADDDGSIFEADINRLAAAGITRGCNPLNNDRFCPDENMKRGEVAAFFSRALNLLPTSEDYFADDDGSTFEDDINRLAAAGITRGCNPPDNDRFCPTGDVTRGEIAAFFARVPGLLDS